MGNELSLNTTNGLSIEYRPEALNDGSETGAVFGFGIDTNDELAFKSYVRANKSDGPSVEADFRMTMDGEWFTEGTLTSEDKETSGRVRLGGRKSSLDQVTGGYQTRLNDEGTRMKLDGGVKLNKRRSDEDLWYLNGALNKKRTMVAGRVAGTRSVDKAWAGINHRFEDDDFTMRAEGYFDKDSAGGFLGGRHDSGLNMAIGGAVGKRGGSFGFHWDLEEDQLQLTDGYRPRQQLLFLDDSDSDSD